MNYLNYPNSQKTSSQGEVLFIGDDVKVVKGHFKGKKGKVREFRKATSEAFKGEPCAIIDSFKWGYRFEMLELIV